MSTDRITLPRRSRAVPTSTRLSTLRVPVLVYAAVLLVLPVLVVGGAMASGWWSTAGHGGVSLSGGGAGQGQGGGEGAGQGAGEGQGTAGKGAPAAPASPADVKGSMTVRQVVETFPSVTAAEVVAAFGAAPGTADGTQLKTLVKEGNGTELPAFRTWLERRLAG